MKKLLIVLITILAMTHLFASQDVAVRLGGAYNLSVGKTAKNAITTDLDRAKVFMDGIGFDAGIEFNLGSNLFLYSDFSLTFPSKVTLKDAYSKDTFKENYETEKKHWENDDYYSIEGGAFLSTIDLHLGLNKRIFSSNSLALYLGGGFGLYRTSFGYRMTMLNDGTTDVYYLDNFFVVSTISADVYARFAYSFSDRFSVSLIAMPGLSFFNVNSEHMTQAYIEGGDPPTPHWESPYPIEGKNYYNPDPEKYIGINPLYENSGFALGFNLGVKLGVSYTF